MNRSAITTVAVLIGILLIVGTMVFYQRSKKSADERDVADESLFNEVARESYADITGGEVAIEDFEGKPLLVTSWASWCPQCAGELQLIDRVVGEVGEGRLKVLAINRNEPREQAQRFLATLPALPNINYILDKQDHFFGSVGGYAMPETIFYNAAGEIKFHKRGNLTEEDIKTAAAATLAEE